MPRQPRKTVTLEGIQRGIQLQKTGVTIKFSDTTNPQRNGSLRIGKRVHWRPTVPGPKREVHKSWEELIDFMMS